MTAALWPHGPVPSLGGPLFPAVLHMQLTRVVSWNLKAPICQVAAGRVYNAGCQLQRA
jgi:hypothetical protein